MICYLNGNILQKHAEFVILDVHGVGYELIVPVSTMCRLPHEGTQTQVYVFTYVREDALRLYGFINMFDKLVFETLLDVSGIGPKVALSLLSTADGFELCHWIVGNRVERLTNIPGIGAKTAERLVLELKTKCQKLMSKFQEQQLFSKFEAQTVQNSERNQVLSGHALLADLNSALTNMGYKEKQFSTILENLQKRLRFGEELVFEEVLKDSLKKLTERIVKG